MSATATVGFLSDTTLVHVSLPDGYGPESEAYSMLVLPDGGRRGILWTDQDRGDAMAAAASLQFVGQSQVGTTLVTEYNQPDPFTGEYFTTVLRFAPAAQQQTFGWMWLTLDPVFDTSETRELFLNGITPIVDGFGLPRVRVAAPLILGSAVQPDERDLVSFFSGDEAVRLWHSGALAADGQVGTSSDSIGTAYGITVQCDAHSLSVSEEVARAVAQGLQRN